LKSATADHTVEEEEVIDVPEAEKESDVLRRATIRLVVEGVSFYGTVQDIEQGKDSGERLYLVKYTDGDLEHLTADQVRDSMCASEEFLLATQPRVPVADHLVAQVGERSSVPEEVAQTLPELPELVRKRTTAESADKIEKTPIKSVNKEISKKPSVAKAAPKAKAQALKPSMLKKPARA